MSGHAWSMLNISHFFQLTYYEHLQEVFLSEPEIGATHQPLRTLFWTIQKFCYSLGGGGVLLQEDQLQRN